MCSDADREKLKYAEKKTKLRCQFVRRKLAKNRAIMPFLFKKYSSFLPSDITICLLCEVYCLFCLIADRFHECLLRISYLW